MLGLGVAQVGAVAQAYNVNPACAAGARGFELRHDD